MGNEDDAERVDTDTDWSGRPVELKRTDGAKLDGTGPLFTDLVVEVINGRRYTQDDDGKWYPVDEKLRVGKDPVDPYADEGKE